MSLILDALKKAEAERRALSAPSLANAPQLPTSTGNHWGWWLLATALLAATAYGLSRLLAPAPADVIDRVVIESRQPESAAEATLPPANPPAGDGSVSPEASAAQPGPTPVAPLPMPEIGFATSPIQSARSEASFTPLPVPEIGYATSPIQSAAPASGAKADDAFATNTIPVIEEGGVIQPTPPEMLSREPELAAAVAAAATAPQGVVEGGEGERKGEVLVPSAPEPIKPEQRPQVDDELDPERAQALSLARPWELPFNERRSLPPLKLNMHVWSADAAKRFVLIDLIRLAEGENDQASGITVARITADGVVVEVRGLRLFLDKR